MSEHLDVKAWCGGCGRSLDVVTTSAGPSVRRCCSDAIASDPVPVRILREENDDALPSP